MDDAEYDRQRDALLDATREALRSARGDESKIKEAIEAYLAAGDALDMSPLELRDYFDISSPGLAEHAGYAGDELEMASAIFTQVSDARYR